MRFGIVGIGFLVGFILFMVFSFWGMGAQLLVKPLVCPDGEFTESDTSVYRNGRDMAATDNWCETPDGRRIDMDQYVVAVMFASFLIPVTASFVLGWIVGKLFPPKPAAPTPAGP